MRVSPCILILILLVLVLVPVLSMAQQSVNPPRICATMEQDSISRARYPERGTLLEFEENLRKKVEELQRSNATGRTKAGVVSIPIIVHVVHNGEAVGTGTNISQAQVRAQIEVLNEDFRRMAGTPGFNNNSVGADIEIEFCLSPVDQNGNAMSEPGIHRFNGNRPDWTRDQIENLLKPTTIWNANFFYNIWTVKFATSDASLIGYAQFPDQSGLSGLPASGPASTDGVVVRFQSFGSVDKGNFPVMVAPFNRGRTLTHETGHWLGLRHIWGDGGCSADDYVTDTPLADSPTSGCPVGRISCSNVNMIENYMDYTNDMCMNIFTVGQKSRMQAVMQMSPRRKSLIEGNLCSPLVADVPTANFNVNNQTVLLGGVASFTDLSSNFPTSWNWTFEGGDPGSSVQRNPSIKYSTPGTFKVSLVAANSLGASQPLEIDGYITVSEEGLCNFANNFTESFTSSVIKLSQFGSYTGYLTGHNSLKSKAIAEYFNNSLGYQFISGVAVNFGRVYISNPESTVEVIVWNARGPQNAPGSVIERKLVLLKRIKDDVDNNRPTTIYFDRETPISGRPYQVGIQLNYAGDSLAIRSSANGESTKATSWLQDQAGTWSPYTIALGANIAMDIKTFVGMQPSVQVSSNKLLVNPGEEVVLNGKGASIFVWNADDGSVIEYTGPQLIVRPTQTTTYTTTGLGLELCYDEATTTVYVRDDVVGVEDVLEEKQLRVFPNPGISELTIHVENMYTGPVEIRLLSLVGQQVTRQSEIKTERQFLKTIPVNGIQSGVYLIEIKLGTNRIIRKWVKK